MWATCFNPCLGIPNSTVISLKTLPMHVLFCVKVLIFLKCWLDIEELQCWPHSRISWICKIAHGNIKSQMEVIMNKKGDNGNHDRVDFIVYVCDSINPGNCLIVLCKMWICLLCSNPYVPHTTHKLIFVNYSEWGYSEIHGFYSTIYELDQWGIFITRNRVIQKIGAGVCVLIRTLVQRGKFVQLWTKWWKAAKIRLMDCCWWFDVGVRNWLREDIPGTSLNGRKLEELRAPELKYWLARRGAPTKGKKADLVAQ